MDNDEPNHWRIALSPYTGHWRYNAEHRHVFAIAIERVLPDGWFVGTSFFKNSFGQPSNYVYVGRKHEGISKSSSVRATTRVAPCRSLSTRCSSARLALLSSTVRGPAP